LVVVGRFTAETIAAAAGCEVVERPAEPVAAEKPLERVPCARGMLGVARDVEGGELGFDQCGSVERLLVAGAWCRVAAVAAAMTGEAERAVGKPGLVAEPAKRLEPDLGCILAAERGSACDQGVRKAGVVVGQGVFEPLP